MKGLTVYKGEGCLRSGKLHRKLNNHELLLQQELVYEGYVDNMNDEWVNWGIIEGEKGYWEFKSNLGAWENEEEF